MACWTEFVRLSLILLLLLVDLVLSVSRCNLTDFTSPGCITNGYCTHNEQDWTTECYCTGVPCDFYLADIAETTGVESFTINMQIGTFGTLYSQSARYYSPRHSYVVRLKAPQNENVKLEFSNIDMGGNDMDCPGGSVFIFDGHGHLNRQYVRKFPANTDKGYCSDYNHRKETMQSTTGFLTVAMTTSGNAPIFKGFNATYTVSGPVHGGWTDWTDWAHCKASCEAKGTQTRSRSCTDPIPRQGGKPCQGNSSEERPCRSKVQCIPHVCERGNYNGCARHAICDVRDDPDPRHARQLVCLCLNGLCKIYMENLCKVAPRGRVLVKGIMGVLRSQLEVHYSHRQKCELTIEGPDSKWMMIQFTEFDMGGRHACTHGHLVVYDGASSSNYSRRYPTTEGAGYCSANQPPSSSDKFENVVVAEGQHVTLIMDTSSKKESIHTGFIAQFTAVEQGYVHQRFSDLEVKIIAFSTMGGVVLLTLFAMTIWCVLRHRKRKKNLRWLHIQYRKQSEEGMICDSENDLWD